MRMWEGGQFLLLCRGLIQFEQQNKIVMGNKHSQHGYSFDHQYDILSTGPPNSGLYRLRSRENGEVYLGRELTCNDEHETYELDCIMHEKVSNPSPFVTRLVKYESDIQDSYCSTANKFHLLFKDIPWLLADQINDRANQNKPFSLEEVDTTITRMAKALKYLYSINHHHGAVTAKAITWPTRGQGRDDVQLVDQWALNGGTAVEGRHRIYRPKDEEDINEKTLQKGNDLYALGQVAKEMINVGHGHGNVSGQPGWAQVAQKIQVLTAQAPHDRMAIYGMLAGGQSRIEFWQPEGWTNSSDSTPMVLSSTNYTQPQLSNISYQHPLPTYSQGHPYPQPATTTTTYQHQPVMGAGYGPPKQEKVYGQGQAVQPVRPHPTFHTAQGSSVGYLGGGFQRKNVAPMAASTVVNNTARNVSLSTAKPNIVITGSTVGDTVRNASAGKVSIMGSNNYYNNGGPTATHSINKSVSSANFNITTQPAPPKNSLTSSIYSGQAPQLPVISSLEKPAKPTVQFNNSNSNNNNKSGSSNASSFNFSSFSSQPPASLPRPTSSINFPTNPPPTPTFSSQQPTPIINNNTNNYEYQVLNAKDAGTNVAVISPAPVITNSHNSSGTYNGINYSFGQSSPEHAFSFKANSNSSGDDGLFTSSDFFSKIKNSTGSKQENISAVVPVPTLSAVYSVSPPPPPQPTPPIQIKPQQIQPQQYSKHPVPEQPSIIPMSVSIEGPSSSHSSSQQVGSSFAKEFPGYGQSAANRYNHEVFQNVTNIPITKSIDNPAPIHQIFDKVSTGHHAYEGPNIVIHESSRTYANNQEYYREGDRSKNRDDYDYVKSTPGKNSRENQPFSTIPEVSQRSASARSDDDRDYVIEEYENGSRYEGYKSNGMRNGKGKFYYQEGSFYDGEWKNNNMHGYGRLYYSNNKIAYEGEWFIDQFHGKGKVYNDEPAPIFGFFDYTNFQNLDEKWKYYEGDLVCDSKEGEGKLVLSNDEFYEGQFRNDKVDGKGRFVSKNGEVVKGIWEDSRLIMKL